jgi:16S rRNA (guanine527-N7)-methyltransferase
MWRESGVGLDGDLGFDVSRETRARLQRHVDLVQRWNGTVRLVAGASPEALWRRHVADSARLFALSPGSAGYWLDLGTGGGFPGLVIAILARELKPDLRVGLVESDQRKAAFLREAARLCEARAEVFAERAERLAPKRADVVSARALCSLGGLLELSVRHLAPAGICLFPKGRTFGREIEAASAKWTFAVEEVAAAEPGGGVVLRIRDVQAR